MPVDDDPDDQLADDSAMELEPGPAQTKPTPRAWRRRRYQVAVAVGALAVIGAGSFATFEWHGRNARHTADRATGGDALTPPNAGAVSDATNQGTPGAPGTPGKSGPPGASGKPGAAPPAGKAQAPVDRPTDVPVEITNSGIIQKDKKTLRVVTARADLTGQRELAWLADQGHPVGEARCTQNFKIGSSGVVRERPTMLICWRVSAKKSVYTLAIDVLNKPSEKDSVAALTKAWNQLG